MEQNPNSCGWWTWINDAICCMWPNNTNYVKSGMLSLSYSSPVALLVITVALMIWGEVSNIIVLYSLLHVLVVVQKVL